MATFNSQWTCTIAISLHSCQLTSLPLTSRRCQHSIQSDLDKSCRVPAAAVIHVCIDVLTEVMIKGQMFKDTRKDAGRTCSCHNYPSPLPQDYMLGNGLKVFTDATWRLIVCVYVLMCLLAVQWDDTLCMYSFYFFCVGVEYKPHTYAWIYAHLINLTKNHGNAAPFTLICDCELESQHSTKYFYFTSTHNAVNWRPNNST